MITIGGHTFDETLIGSGAIIDIGCRAFDLAKHFTDKQVHCVDMDDVFMDVPPNAVTYQVAISDKAGETTFYKNGEATMIRELDPDPTFEHIDKKYCNTCKTITMDDLYAITGTDVDLLKLDCEGAEYLILGETFKPIPKQISVEFHYHCVPKTHEEHFNNIMNRLMKDYTAHNMVWEARHGCGFNYWDILFIRRW